VKRYADKKEYPHEPEELAVLELGHTDFPEESGVRVDCFRAGEDLEIAEHVADHEADESDASDRHYDLLPDHGVPEGYLAVADSHASRRRDGAKMDCRIQILWVLHTNLNSFGERFHKSFRCLLTQRRVRGRPLRFDDPLTKFFLRRLGSHTGLLRFQANRSRDLNRHLPQVG
jgi:hypothetical protein